jgi:hypothetical protein
LSTQPCSSSPPPSNLIEVVTGIPAMTVEGAAIADPSRFAEPELAHDQLGVQSRIRL